MVTVGIDMGDFVSLYPRLYHMAHRASWTSIAKHGLLSTAALLDLFEIFGEERNRLESCHRPEYVRIEHGRNGEAWIRDQKPMSDKGLSRALVGNLTPSDWYRTLNGYVFFWTSLERLERLLCARAYRNDEHLILQLDTAQLANEHWKDISLCPINSGCTVPVPHERGRHSFLHPDEYPFEEWRLRRGVKEAVVEVAVARGVPRVRDFVISRELRRGRCE